MTEKLDDFKTAVLPERKFGFWQMAGPGAILVGLSIGAGEIIVWPLVVAEYGASMIWAAVLDAGNARYRSADGRGTARIAHACGPRRAAAADVIPAPVFHRDDVWEFYTRCP